MGSSQDSLQPGPSHKINFLAFHSNPSLGSICFFPIGITIPIDLRSVLFRFSRYDARLQWPVPIPLTVEIFLKFSSMASVVDSEILVSEPGCENLAHPECKLPCCEVISDPMDYILICDSFWNAQLVFWWKFWRSYTAAHCSARAFEASVFGRMPLRIYIKNTYFVKPLCLFDFSFLSLYFSHWKSTWKRDHFGAKWIGRVGGDEAGRDNRRPGTSRKRAGIKILEGCQGKSFRLHQLDISFAVRGAGGMSLLTTTAFWYSSFMKP